MDKDAREVEINGYYDKKERVSKIIKIVNSSDISSIKQRVTNDPDSDVKDLTLAKTRIQIVSLHKALMTVLPTFFTKKTCKKTI